MPAQPNDTCGSIIVTYIWQILKDEDKKKIGAMAQEANVDIETMCGLLLHMGLELCERR